MTAGGYMAAGHSEVILMRDHVIAAVEAHKAGNSEDLNLIVEVLLMCEEAKTDLRLKGYGWAGLNIVKTVEQVPEYSSEVAWWQ